MKTKLRQELDDFLLYDCEGLPQELVRQIENIKTQAYHLDHDNYNQAYREEMQILLLKELLVCKGKVGEILRLI